MSGQLWAFLKSKIRYICQETDEQADTFRAQLQDAGTESGGRVRAVWKRKEKVVVIKFWGFLFNRTVITFDLYVGVKCKSTDSLVFINPYPLTWRDRTRQSPDLSLIEVGGLGFFFTGYVDCKVWCWHPSKLGPNFAQGISKGVKIYRIYRRTQLVFVQTLYKFGFLVHSVPD